ncbi:RrF2 family transcriptional regulator [Desulfosporosinus sp. SB140]|uniref:RrF2 family transcriptional regulator n=1 Tax=Desulfosporosinus paludis TaxID=3115649 RepID=UPI003890B93A
MKRNKRLSVALHVLLHMAERPDAAMTSEEMSTCAGTNAVVIRRTFAGLREAQIVSSLKGHGGGWRLVRPLSEITLEDVQRALDERVVTSPSTHNESPGCLIEKVIHLALDDAVAEASRVLDRRLATITLADIAADVYRLDRAISSTPKDDKY